MPNTKSAEKALRKNKRQQLRNKIYKSKIKTSIKKFQKAVKSKDKEKVKKLLVETQSIIDHAHAKGIIHKNNAARKKSKLFHLYNNLVKS